MTTNPYVRVVAVLLLLEALAFYAFASRRETAPTVEPLVLFPSVIGDWLIYRDFPIDKEILDILKADDTLNRFYVNQSTRQLAGLYIAYFQTQRYGQAPHSPKIACRDPAGSRSRRISFSCECRAGMRRSKWINMLEDVVKPGFWATADRRAAALGGVWLAMRPGMGAAQTVEADTVLNVRQFGAKGDGKSDDTKSIQSAIDAAAARGGAVFLPPGVYRSAELQMRPHVSLTGIPAWDYEHGFGSVIRLADDHARCLLNITGAFGVTIDGISLDGGKLGAGVHGVWLNKPDYGKQEDTFRIERCQIANFSGDGVRLTRAWCFSIRHSMIAYNAGDGISLRGWDGFFLDNWLIRKPAAPGLPRAKRTPRARSPGIASSGTAKAF
jgi:hypothetical protein